MGRLLRLRPLLVLAGLLLGGACADTATNPSPVTVRDSAGITVVENPAPGDDAILSWSVDEVPRLDVGSLDGPETHQLFRVQDVHVLPDRRVVVADGGSGEIRFYDLEGRHLESWGGQGEGPGEFRMPVSLLPWPAGDSLGVWDGRLRRLTVYGPGGEVGRTLSFPEVAGVPSPSLTDLLPDGGLVLTGIEFRFQDSPELVRPPIHGMVVEPDGTLRDTLGALPGSEAVIRTSEQAVNILRVPFARTSVTQVVGDEVIFTPNDAWELRYHGPAGALRRIVRLARPPRAVTEGDLEALREHRVAQAPEAQRAGVRAANSNVLHPETMPAFQRVLPDALGYTWVQEYRPAFEEGPERWSVFDAEGRFMGRVETPAGLTVLQVGEEFLAGRARDELDVEHVQVWGLTR